MGSDLVMMRKQGYDIGPDGKFYDTRQRVYELEARVRELEEENLRLKVQLAKEGKS